MIKILDVGSAGDGDGANDLQVVFGGAGELEVTRLDIRKSVKPDIVHDICKPLPNRYKEAFDIVFASHVMEHIDRAKVMDAFKTIYSTVKVGGELYVVVPSMEYVAAEIYFNRMNLAIQASLFGAQNHPGDYHKVGFTLNWLRFILERVLGMSIRKAYQAPLTLEIEDEPITVLQNVVIGLKVEKIEEDPSEALE